MKTTINNIGGNRALVCYATNLDHYHFNDAIDEVLQDSAKGGGAFLVDLTDETADISLKSGDWRRGLIVSAQDIGEALVGVYFYTEPEPPEEDEEEVELEDLDDEEEQEEPEPPSIPEQICRALNDAMLKDEQGIFGASSFVIDPTATEFELEVE